MRILTPTCFERMKGRKLTHLLTLASVDRRSSSRPKQDSRQQSSTAMKSPSFAMLDEEVNKLFTKDHRKHRMIVVINSHLISVQGQLKFKSKTTVKEETSAKEVVEENSELR